MTDDRSRRALLRGGAIALTALHAGCGGKRGPGGGGGSSPTNTGPDPDEGTDSYGVLARNLSGKSHRLRITAKQPWEGRTVFQETVELADEQRRSRDTVVEEPKEHTVSAALDGAIDGTLENDAKADLYKNHVWITPGSDTAPDVRNIRVVIDTVTTKDAGEIATVEVTVGKSEG